MCGFRQAFLSILLFLFLLFSFFFIFVLLFIYKPSGSLWLGSIVIADIGVQIAVTVIIAAHDAFFQELPTGRRSDHFLTTF